jgi:predicted outer membrane protein
MLRLIPIALFMSTAAFSPLLQRPERPPSAPSGQESRKARPEAKQADELFASWLILESNNQMALAELAVQRAQDPKLKQLAQKMLEEHRGLQNKLQAFASESGPIDAGSPARPAEPKSTRATGSEEPMAAFDHLGLLQELSSKCLESARKELVQKQGADFDRCYAGMLLFSHMQANDMFAVFQGHASPELAPVLTEGQQAIAMHLQHARELAQLLAAPSADTRTRDGK